MTLKYHQKKLLIELKDNHIWYKNEQKNGKAQAKYDAGIHLAKEIDYTYELVFVNKYMDFIKKYFKTN